jgi:asparagine synthetase B (glutamine-hydrolysing)
MLERFRAGQPPLDDDFGGTFVAVVCDAKRLRLAVQPDRQAMGVCFYAEGNGEFVVSNRALRLASYFQSALDGHSVLSQMRGTHMPFGRTLFAGVRRLMGCAYLEIDLARGTGEVRKPQSLYVPTREISYADAVDVVANTVKTTVGRLLAAEPVQFDLTGGNDTRVIASAIENITRNNGSHRFGFRVMDPEGAPDVRVARRVAETCGWPLTRMDRHVAGQAAVEELGPCATGCDGQFTVNYIWDRVHFDRIYAAHGQWKTHVGAAAAELFRGFFYRHEVLTIGRSSKVNYESLLAYRTYASRGVDLGVFGANAPTFDAHDDVLMAPYRAIGEEGGSRTNAEKLDQMYMQRHCYRSGNTLGLVHGFSDVRVPFLSWELAGLGLSLPWKYRANRGLMQRVIGRLSPRLANIPNIDGQPMKPLSLATFPSYVLSEIPMIVNRAGRVVRRVLGRSGEIARASLPQPQAAYLTVLDNPKTVPAIFDPEKVRQIRSQVESGQRTRDSIVTFYVLATLELLLQQVPALRRQLVFD